MGQAFDDRGHPLGPGVFGDTMREVFDKLVNLHPDAHELRIKALEEKRTEENARPDQTWPYPHPIPCAICGRDLTSAEGFALVAIRVTDRWVCASHDEETAF